MGSATAVNSALAPCHGSRLLPLRLLFAHRPAVPFSTSPAFRKVFTKPAQPVYPSRCACSFCPSFDGFRWAGFKSLLNPPESFAPCWWTVATGYPLGNRDSLRIETFLSYLTRLGAVSHRSSPPSPWLASLTARERRQRGWWILPPRPNLSIQF